MGEFKKITRARVAKWNYSSFIKFVNVFSKNRAKK